jgi:hypothetical protein
VDQTNLDDVSRALRHLPFPLSSPRRRQGSFPSRRHILRGLAGMGLGLGSLLLPNIAAAKKPHKGKKAKRKQPKKRSETLPLPAFNAFGCLNVGQTCRGDSSLCCSGICQGAAPVPGAPDTSTCVAHDAGVCKQTQTTCEVGTLVQCVADDANSFCFRTTGNAAFCASAQVDINNYCRFCAKDTDCVAEYGPGAACVLFDGICAGFCGVTGLTACMPPAV